MWLRVQPHTRCHLCASAGVVNASPPAFTYGDRALPFLILLAALESHPAAAQYLPEETEQWYPWTDDGCFSHYVVGVGTAGAVGDTVVVLHGGWEADHSYLFGAVLPLASHHL
ncbi:hypothetical protein BSZ36_09300 [Rubricoccus marinus]|uniref:Uncharacterized protein n=1 Tax=Rubricoccus marinus TaxID=716817 RepID=A0A259TZK0_9BACT|nr:hypothetical protein BSZ36_09300 [Rubricoccus marinus]